VDVYLLEESFLLEQFTKNAAFRGRFYKYLACILAQRLGKSSAMLAQMSADATPQQQQSILFKKFGIDPNESVTVSYAIQNVGGGPTTNLVATLQATGGVTSPGAPQNYGAIAPNATVSRNFTFTAAGSCGGTIMLTFQLQDGATNFGTLSVTYILGALVASAATFAQNFDGVVAPALPAARSPTC
jgi:hypothetical protein